MTAWLLDTLLYTGLLIGVVLAVRRPAGRILGPNIAYALWALPFLRLLMPPIVLPASYAPAEAPVEVIAAPIADAAYVAPPGPAIAPVATTPDFAELAAAPAWQWSDAIEIALAVWLAGALTFLLWRMVSYRRMCRMLLERARPVGEVGRIRLVETPEVTAPVAFGVFDKVVALPPCFMAKPDRAARDLAIAHELAHHRGHDLLANFAAQLLLALHWFNPLAWYGWRAMRRDQEAACDARVLAGRGRDDRARYAALIAGIATGPRLALAAPMACPILGEASIIHRLRSLNMSDITPTRRRLGRALVGAGALALPLTASISYAAVTRDAETPAAAAPAARTQHRMVVIEKVGGATLDDATLFTHIVRRDDGSTVELRTDRQLSDQEARERVADAFASLPEPPVPPAPPAPPSAPLAPLPPMPPMPPVQFDSRGMPTDPNFEAKMEAWGEAMEQWGEQHGERYAEQARAHAEQAMAHARYQAEQAQVHARNAQLHADAQARAAQAQARAAALAARNAPEVIESCDLAEQRRTTTADGRTRVVICERDIEAQARLGAMAGLRSARASIAGNRAMPEEVRRDVLRELDREIADLQRGES